MTPLLSIHHTLGAVFLSFAFACAMYGTLMTQVFHYFRKYPSDRILCKVTVVALALLETADQAFIAHFIYYYAISNFAQPTVLAEARMTWSFVMQLMAGAVVGTIVKVFLGCRVWISLIVSGRNFRITGLIFSLTLTQFGLAIAYSIQVFQLPNVFAVRQLQVLGSINLGAGVLTDLVTAASLCFFLTRLQTGYRRSDSLVHMLCAYAISTGILTSAVGLLTLILYNATPNDNLYFIATYYILDKLYAISYVVTLNTRRQVVDEAHRPTACGAIDDANILHLETRMPNMSPSDLEQRDEETSDPGHSSGMSVADTPQYTPKGEFPFNSFHPGTGSRKMQFGQAL